MALGSLLVGDLSLSIAFTLELMVEADDTGCLGRELLSGGDNFGRGADMKAFSLVLPLAEIALGLCGRLIAGAARGEGVLVLWF